MIHKKVIRVFFLFSLLVQPLLSSSNGLISKKTENYTITIISTQNQAEPLWFISDKNFTFELKNPPNTLHKISSVYISEKYNKILVMSYATSSPRLDVFKLTDIFADRESSVIKTINPYPDEIEIIGFKKHYFVYRLKGVQRTIDLTKEQYVP